MTTAAIPVTCPAGDPFCPCQDGDACHYENAYGVSDWLRGAEEVAGA